jgi:hypothetical protein
MASYPISNVPRRIVYVASGVGPYAFPFEILTQTDLAVFKDDQLLTLTTDYTVSIDSDGTGGITLTASPIGATQIALVGARAIERVSDFTTGGDFFAVTVNEELDSLTIFAQQNAEAVDRALKAPQTDPTTIDMTLPRAADRAGKFLAFDNAGNPVPGAVPDELEQVLAIEDEIIAVANIDTQIVTVANQIGTDLDVTVVADDLRGANTIGTVAGNITNVNTVGGNTTNINAVAGQLGTDLDVTVVAADLRGANTIGAVAGSIVDVNEVAANLGTDLPVTVVAADLSGVDNIGTVAGAITNVNAVGGSIADVNEVAANLGTDLPVTVVAADLSGTDTIGTVAGIAANVTTVAGISSNVTTVATNNTNVTTVATDIANVNTTATNITNVNAVGGSITNVNTVAANIGTDLPVTVVAADLSGANTIGAVAGDLVNINTVAGISTEIGTVAGIDTEVTTLAGLDTEIQAIYADLPNLNVKVGKTSDTGAAILPAGTVLERDGSPLGGYLRFNTDSNEFEGYNGTAWSSVGGSAISDDVATTTELYPIFVDATTGTAANVYVSDGKLGYTPSTGELSASQLVASNGIVVNSATVTANYTIPVGSNATSAGPMEVASGAEVTVSAGSVWVII